MTIGQGKLKGTIIKRICVLMMCFFALFSAAQDLHLSQYEADPLSLNPAMAGLFDGKYRIHAHYRTQWSSIATKPYLTTAISYDTPVKKFGLGIEIMNNRAGAGDFNVFNALVSASYDLSLDKENKNHISFGVQGGIIQKSVDMQKLYFSSQYSPFNGGSFDKSLPSGELLSNSSIILPDLNAGLIYYLASDKNKVNPFIGFSAFHLTSPQESFFSRPNKLPKRYVANAGCKVYINENIQMSPQVLLMQQGNANEVTASLAMYYYLKESETYLIFSPTYRNKDAAIMELGMKKGKYTYKLSYDVNTSTLNPATNGRGGFEISVTYIAKKARPEGIKTCPEL